MGRRRTPERPFVHTRGDRRLDAVLDFTAFAARPMPLLMLLDEAPRRVAALLQADVCSLYVVEGDKSELVMRGNVGFSGGALGEVRLRIGEGLTGEALEYMRPVSTARAEQSSAYKHFAELGEERFPVFLAVPIYGKAGPLGALVVQRRKAAFAAADIEVLALIGGLIAAGIRHAELADEARERRSRRSSGGTRKVTLTGRPGVVGRALGVAAALRRPRARANSRPSGSDIATDVHRLRGAFDVADKAIRGIRGRAQAIGLDQETAFLTTYGHIIDDMRLRERALELAGAGVGVGQALSRVARDVTRTAVSLTRDAFLEDRARDIEDLCDALTMMAGDEKGPDLPTKAILVGDTLTVFDLLVTARTMPAGIALSERATGPRTRALLKLMNVPSVTDVQGLFRWVSDGDVALLDGDHGLLVLNPSKVEMAAAREQRAKSGRGGK